MVEPTTLARPYARAAFDVARNSGALDAWQVALTTLAGASAAPRVAALLKEPARTAGQRVDMLKSLVDDLPPGCVNFLQVMADNNRLALLPDVACLYAALKAEAEATVTVEVTSAFALTDDEAEQLASAMAARLNRSVNIRTHTDASLLGGAIIRAGDLVIDGSVRGRLEKLAGALTP